MDRDGNHNQELYNHSVLCDQPKDVHKPCKIQAACEVRGKFPLGQWCAFARVVLQLEMETSCRYMLRFNSEELRRLKNAYKHTASPRYMNCEAETPRLAMLAKHRTAMFCAFSWWTARFGSGDVTQKVSLHSENGYSTSTDSKYVIMHWKMAGKYVLFRSLTQSNTYQQKMICISTDFFGDDAKRHFFFRVHIYICPVWFIFNGFQW
jgi:hypothetical protein